MVKSGSIVPMMCQNVYRPQIMLIILTNLRRGVHLKLLMAMLAPDSFDSLCALETTSSVAHVHESLCSCGEGALDAQKLRCIAKSSLGESM